MPSGIKDALTPAILPCGCRALYRYEGRKPGERRVTVNSPQVVLTTSGIRVCRHDRRWVLRVKWEEVKS